MDLDLFLTDTPPACHLQNVLPGLKTVWGLKLLEQRVRKQLLPADVKAFTSGRISLISEEEALSQAGHGNLAQEAFSQRLLSTS